MGKDVSAINLQFGNGRLPYEDLIPFTIGNTLNRDDQIDADQIHAFQIMPSSRGSHSEISGT